MNYIIVSVLVLFSGIFSGLTLGFFSLDLAGLERKVRMGNKDAAKVYPIRKKGNLLLCTLLLGNVAVNSAMAVFLGSIATGVAAGLISTSLIVVFGEIIPQAAFSRHALTVGSKMAWFVRVIIVLLYPVTYPISWILDKVLGEEIPTIWGKKELKEIIKQSEDSKQTLIDQDEERIMLGALDFSNKTVLDVMVPREDVFTLESDQIVHQDMVNEIKKSTFSRIPVMDSDKKTTSGLLVTKDLLGYSVSEELTVSELMSGDGFIVLDEKAKLDDAMNQFISSKTIFGIVTDGGGLFTGVLALEDIIEQIMQRKILDEDD
jgi:metal transporter CNNM|tara:strand:- start:5512 stop:6465 length:954 start_codon:yes stop_codon:yes gene_type:complete